MFVSHYLNLKKKKKHFGLSDCAGFYFTVLSLCDDASSYALHTFVFSVEISKALLKRDRYCYFNTRGVYTVDKKSGGNKCIGIKVRMGPLLYNNNNNNSNSNNNNNDLYSGGQLHPKVFYRRILYSFTFFCFYS